MPLLTPILSTAVWLALAEGAYPWWNYPGLELWKFVNLLVFIAVALYVHRRFGRFVREGLRARGERIKRELETARQEKDQALSRLSEVEERFAKLESEAAAIRERADQEARAERDRIKQLTELEIVKIREQAERELDNTGKAARHELRRFAAQESIRLAEEILVREIKPEDDARLTKISVDQLGRSQG